ncbi:MAG TPA: serine/threonine-protein kinase [Pirellulales bacterium]
MGTDSAEQKVQPVAAPAPDSSGDESASAPIHSVAAAAAPVTEIEVGRSDANIEPLPTIKPYIIKRKLGEGAMGKVYLALDPRLDREVAIKLLPSDLVGDEQRVLRFLREARMAAKVQHANTVVIYEVDVRDGQAFLVMELVDGDSLDKLSGPVSWPVATQMIRDAAAGLAAAHEMSVIHRDVKPANLMRTKKGNTKVVDFGLARALQGNTQLTQQGTLLGTPAYMAPEMWIGQEADARSDTYALTCSYYQLLTGQPPFDATTIASLGYQHRHEPFPDPRERVADLPEPVYQILIRGSSKEPGDRYPNAGAMLDDLARALPSASEASDAARRAPLFDQGSVRDVLPNASETVVVGISSAATARMAPPMPIEATPTIGRSLDPTWLIVGAGVLAICLLMAGFFWQLAYGTMKIEFISRPENMMVKLDGEAIDSATFDEPMRLQTGQHSLEVTAPNFVPITKQFDIIGGRQELVTVDLVSSDKNVAPSSLGDKVAASRLANDSAPPILPSPTAAADEAPLAEERSSVKAVPEQGASAKEEPTAATEEAAGAAARNPTATKLAANAKKPPPSASPPTVDTPSMPIGPPPIVDEDFSQVISAGQALPVGWIGDGYGVVEDRDHRPCLELNKKDGEHFLSLPPAPLGSCFAVSGQFLLNADSSRGQKLILVFEAVQGGKRERVDIAVSGMTEIEGFLPRQAITLNRGVIHEFRMERRGDLLSVEIDDKIAASAQVNPKTNFDSLKLALSPATGQMAKAKLFRLKVELIDDEPKAFPVPPSPQETIDEDFNAALANRQALPSGWLGDGYCVMPDGSGRPGLESNIKDADHFVTLPPLEFPGDFYIEGEAELNSKSSRDSQSIILVFYSSKFRGKSNRIEIDGHGKVLVNNDNAGQGSNFQTKRGIQFRVTRFAKSLQVRLGDQLVANHPLDSNISYDTLRIGLTNTTAAHGSRSNSLSYTNRTSPARLCSLRIVPLSPQEGQQGTRDLDVRFPQLKLEGKPFDKKDIQAQFQDKSKSPSPAFTFFAGPKKNPYIVLVDKEHAPYGLLSCDDHGTGLHGPAYVISRENKSKILLYYQNNARNGPLKVWNGDGEILLYSEFQNGKKRGVTCLFRSGLPLIIENWSQAGQSEQFLVAQGPTEPQLVTREDLDEQQTSAFDLAFIALHDIEQQIAVSERDSRAQMVKLRKEASELLRKMGASDRTVSANARKTIDTQTNAQRDAWTKFLRTLQ